MLAQQRQEAILREVERVGGARVSELVDILGVSDMTVRRDIEARRIVSDQVGQLIEAHPFVVEAGLRPRKVNSS